MRKKESAEEPESHAAGAGLVDAYSTVRARLRHRAKTGSDDADDLIQEASIRILQHQEPSLINDFTGYFLHIVRNLFIDRQRLRHREAVRFDRFADPDSVGHTVEPERVLIAKERLEIIMEAIEKLPPRCREAFKLRCIDGLTYVAIAQKMGISHSAVAKHLAEALSRLHRVISQADGNGP